jgi:hypothetical protein
MKDLQAQSDTVVRWRRRRAMRRLSASLKAVVGWTLVGVAIVWLVIAGLAGLGHL